MTGFRIAYVCAPPSLTEAMLRVHQYSMLCAPILSQEAALEALEHGLDDIAMMREQYRLRRNFIVKSFNEIGLPCHMPNGAFYSFPSIRETGLTSREFAVQLLEQQRVAVVPGDAFGPERRRPHPRQLLRRHDRPRKSHRGRHRQEFVPRL